MAETVDQATDRIVADAAGDTELARARLHAYLAELRGHPPTPDEVAGILSLANGGTGDVVVGTEAPPADD